MTKRALMRALIATGALLVLHGCKSDTDTAKDAKMESVVVLEGGEPPLLPLRYALKEGTMTTSTMELLISSMTKTTSTGESFAKAPGLRIVISSGPVMTLPSGNARFDIKIVSAETIMVAGVDPEVERGLNTSAALLRDVGGWVEVDDRGIIQRRELNQAAENPKLPIRLLMTIIQARSSLARVILPAEPVGSLARWEARKRIEVFGFQIQQTDRYTIKERKSDELTLAVQIVNSAPEQTVTFEEEGVEFNLESLSVSARGELFVKLDQLEASGQVEGRGTELLSVERGETEEKVEVDRAFQIKVDAQKEKSSAADPT